ncbi:MAG TPA: hypothetical protein VMD97_08505 [Candidatus Aquilonibacter sp.]|nr:hypothetical protein [Candidatus Aquilonibacter sp.]
MRAAEVLLRGAVDYAGLFPPAALDLERAVANYEAYRDGEDAWALGRFVLPVTRLAEFADRWPQHVREWPISLLLGVDFDSELRLAVDAGLRLDAVECRPAGLQDVKAIRMRLRKDAELFVEAPQGVGVEELLKAVKAAGACAKIRMGGVTAEAIPSAELVAAFLCACARHELKMKATAGLHHAVRAEHALTYAADAPRATMHGFVNFFVAAMLAMRGEDEKVLACLLEMDPEAFVAGEKFAAWGEDRFGLAEMEGMRESFVMSFGSCSFEEPMADLRAMRWVA